MTIKVGDKLPQGVFTVMTDNGPAPMSTDDLFNGKKVVLFAVPGAFTPGCSMSHLPSYLDLSDEIYAQKVDTIACMSVNDTFVMHAWGVDKAVGDKILMLADGNGDYTKSIGLDNDNSNFGMGIRCKRFAMIADDGVITDLMIEEPGKIEASKADSVLSKL
ncbi:MAG: peroxiredoxin [Woeseiaceae bacterium]|jgi:peroxiredoxin|tara:strand:- start:20158 stop:20640 length:483 start_codon:yes stop_codon:yes gene_type:complete